MKYSDSTSDEQRAVGIAVQRPKEGGGPGAAPKMKTPGAANCAAAAARQPARFTSIRCQLRSHAHYRNCQLLDSLADAPAMHGRERQRLEHQKFQCALEDFRSR